MLKRSFNNKGLIFFLCCVWIACSGFQMKKQVVKQMVSHHRLTTEQLLSKMGRYRMEEWETVSEEGKLTYIEGYMRGLSVTDMLYRDTVGFDLCACAFNESREMVNAVNEYYALNPDTDKTVIAVIYEMYGNADSQKD